MQVSSFSPATLDCRGGEVVTIQGNFDPNVALEVVFAMGAGGQALLAYSGAAQQGSRVLPSYVSLSAVSPAFPTSMPIPMSVSLHVREADNPTTVAIAPNTLTVLRPTYASQVYALRTLHPPVDATGPRSLTDEQSAAPMLAGAMLQPLLDALGEAYTDFGGTRSTFASTNAAAGATSLTLDSTHRLNIASRLLIGNQVYSVGGVTPQQVTGLTPYGQKSAGLVAPVAACDEVVHVTPKQSQLGRLHESYFLDSAEGIDLSTCGRNLGLARDPSIRDDATYAAACRAIAYGPRGTMQGIRLALNALVGKGNYTLRQDTLNHPFVVFISLPLKLTQGQTSTGRTYLSGPRSQTPTDASTFSLPAPVVGLERIVLPPMDSVEACDATRPPPPWVYAGTGEASAVSVVAGGTGAGGFVMGAPATAYNVGLPQDPLADLAFSVMVRPLPKANAAAGTTGLAWGASFAGRTPLARLDVTLGGAMSLQPCDGSGVALSVSPLVVAASGLVEVAWLRVAPDAWVLSAGNASLLLRDAQLPTATDSEVSLRRLRAADANVPDVLLGTLRVHRTGGRNYAEAQGTASVAGRAVSFDQAFAKLTAGQQVTLRRSAAVVRAPGQTSGPSGSNNGDYLADAASTSGATLIRFRRSDAVLGSQVSAGNQMDLPDAALRYPQDLGRQVVVGSTSSNAGTYYIAALIDALGKVCSLPYVRPCASCRLVRADGSAPSFVSQASTPITVQPAFAVEAGLAYSIPQGFTLTPDGADVQVALWQPMPGALMPYDVTFNDHLGSTLIDDEEPVVVLQDDDPVRFSTYPVYLSDPLAFVGNYLDQLTVAGVRAVVDVV